MLEWRAFSIPRATLGFSSLPSVLLFWVPVLTEAIGDLPSPTVSYRLLPSPTAPMDTTYRSDLRELNELNFARFDAKLEQRVAEVKSELRQELEQLRVEVRTGLASLRGEFGERLEAQTTTLVKWMLGIWVAAIPTLGGVIVLVEHFLSPHP